MGGVFSTVADLARWVAGFAAAFPPDGDGDQATATTTATNDAHPLRPASRRQMQLPQAVTGWRAAGRLPGGPPAPPEYYGFGLFVDEDPSLGRVVSHSGGYPGFGSNMRWHPATGIGVIALGNGTYAPMSPLTGLVLDALVPGLQRVPGRARARRDRRPAQSRRPLAADPRGPGKGQPPPGRLGRRRRRRAVHRERRPRRPLQRAPPHDRPDPRAHRRRSAADPAARPSPTPRPTAAGG